MIVYRKTAQLRVRRTATPEPPFWAATTIAPYGMRRATPLAIDYLDLRVIATGERLEVNVAEGVRDELERLWERQTLAEPVLVESTEFAEEVFRRGESIVQLVAEHHRAAMQLISTRGALPEHVPPGTVIAIAAWPLEHHRLEPMLASARERGLRFGVVVPVIFPVTTNLTALAEIAELAGANGAAFLAGIAIELDPTAKHVFAESLSLDDDDETYAMLFHADPEPLHIATERHIAALAAAGGMADFIVPPRWGESSNWNGAVLLTRTASRMIAMEQDLDLAGLLARSARIVAELDKPIERIAAAASLAIVDALDDASVDILTEWLATGRSSFVDAIDAKWRLRRDHGV